MNTRKGLQIIFVAFFWFFVWKFNYKIWKFNLMLWNKISPSSSFCVALFFLLLLLLNNWGKNNKQIKTRSFNMWAYEIRLTKKMRNTQWKQRWIVAAVRPFHIFIYIYVFYFWTVARGVCALKIDTPRACYFCRTVIIYARTKAKLATRQKKPKGMWKREPDSGANPLPATDNACQLFKTWARSLQQISSCAACARFFPRRSDCGTNNCCNFVPKYSLLACILECC